MAKDYDKKFFTLGILIFLTATLSAQEVDIYKRIMKESIQMDFLFDPLEMKIPKDSASGFLELNVLKSPLPQMGYNHKQNSLFLHYKDSLPVDKKWTVSPYLTMEYTNLECFDPSSTETVSDIIVNGFIVPVASIVNVNPIQLALYLMRIGVLSDEPFVSRETKKERALREIKNIYGVE
jgi:hypothetical protein